MQFPLMLSGARLALDAVLAVMAILSSAPASAQDFVRGYDAYHEGDYETAFANLQPLAERGFLAPQYYLGVMYANGHGVQLDYPRAVHWFRKAAEQGDADSQFELATTLAQGVGVERDIEEAFKWLCRAAELGHEEAGKSAFELDIEC